MTTTGHIIALDIDLRKIYAWCSACGEVCNAAPNAVAVFQHVNKQHYMHAATILIEVAGAVDYTDNKAVAHNKRRWTIWNIAAAATLGAWFDESMAPTLSTLLVAPSSVWTHGHDVKVRHKLAGCTAKNKDLRECQAMIWFYKKHHTDWVTFEEFLANL